MFFSYSENLHIFSMCWIWRLSLIDSSHCRFLNLVQKSHLCSIYQAKVYYLGNTFENKVIYLAFTVKSQLSKIVRVCVYIHIYMYIWMCVCVWRNLLWGIISSCNYEYRQVPRSIGCVSNLDTQESQELSFSMSPKPWEPRKLFV